LAAARKISFDECRPPINLGCDVHTRKPIENASEMMSEAIRDTNNLVLNAKIEKRELQTNAIDSVMESVPLRVSSNIQTPTDKRNFVDELVDGFTEGTLPHTLIPENYSRPKEPGIMLPHTMNPQDWLAINASKMVTDQFDGALIPCFASESIMDLAPYSHGPADYVLFSKDDRSPMHLSRNPALYCSEGEGRDWAWRLRQPLIVAEVSLEHTRTGSNSTDQLERARMTREKQCFYADEFVTEPINRTDYYSPDVPLPKHLKQKFGVEALLLFAKRGFSTANEVYDDPGVVHIVSLNVAMGIKDETFTKIMLSDFNSVILFPTIIWDRSRFVAKNGRKKYRSSWGIQLAVDHSKFSLYFALAQMSHTRAMFKAWDVGLPYDHQAHSAKLLSNLASGDVNFRSLFGSYADRSATDKKRALGRLLQLVPGPVVGMWICPAQSKIGKAGIHSIQQDSRFDRDIDAFDDVDLTRDDDYVYRSGFFSMDEISGDDDENF
jgi:hypothetical protein